MAAGFGTAIYTGCAPGQGLDGVAGMQFQSKSSEISRRHLEVVRRHLLYELPQELLRQGRPVSDYPASFGHVWDGGVLATATGLYLGREVNGSRPGNFLTHALLTEDPKTYRSVRPVQLFGASFWRDTPEPATSSAPISSWSPGPLDVGAAHSFVADQPHGWDMLRALLSELICSDAAKQRRVVFISEDVRSFLLWMTAATLLLPHEQALRIGFKVFTNDPARTALRVVAINPHWSSFAGSVENDLGYAVFDLIRAKWTERQADEEAVRWVELFRTVDPHDVTEMVELAAAVKGPPVGSAALDLARAAVLREAPAQRSVEHILQWLEGERDALREAYGGTLFTVLRDTSNLSTVRRCDAIAAASYPLRASEIRLKWLRLELEQAISSGRPVPPGEAPPGPMPAGAEAAAREMVRIALRQARGNTFDAIFRVATRFGVPMAQSDAAEAFEAFARFCVTHPDQVVDPRHWAVRSPVGDMVRDQLRDRLRQDERSATEIGDAWRGRLFAPNSREIDLDDPLDRALLSAAMAHAHPDARLDLVGRVLRQSHVWQLRRATDALWARVPITPLEARRVATAIPQGTRLDVHLFDDLVEEASESDPTALDALEVCSELAVLGFIRNANRISKLAKENLWVLNFRANALRVSHGDSEKEETERFKKIPERLVRAHTPALVEQLNSYDRLSTLRRHLVVMPEPVQVAFLLQWHQQLKKGRPLPNWIAITFYLSINLVAVDSMHPHPGVDKVFQNELKTFAENGTTEQVKEVRAHLHNLDHEWAKMWDAFYKNHGPRKRWRAWTGL